MIIDILNDVIDYPYELLLLLFLWLWLGLLLLWACIEVGLEVGIGVVDGIVEIGVEWVVVAERIVY